jgi:hypothetical protein
MAPISADRVDELPVEPATGPDADAHGHGDPDTRAHAHAYSHSDADAVHPSVRGARQAQARGGATFRVRVVDASGDRATRWIRIRVRAR